MLQRKFQHALSIVLQVMLCLSVETTEGIQQALGLRGLATINWAWKAADMKKP